MAGVRPVGRDRPLPPQARSPRLLPGPGVGVPVLASGVSWLLTGLRYDVPDVPGPRSGGVFPAWVTYTKHSIWIYDTTHFRGCDGIAVTVVMDLVTRKWLATIVSAEQTST